VELAAPLRTQQTPYAVRQHVLQASALRVQSGFLAELQIPEFFRELSSVTLCPIKSSAFLMGPVICAPWRMPTGPEEPSIHNSLTLVMF
jgi:hypothetical protein